MFIKFHSVISQIARNEVHSNNVPHGFMQWVETTIALLEDLLEDGISVALRPYMVTMESVHLILRRILRELAPVLHDLEQQGRYMFTQIVCDGPTDYIQLIGSEFHSQIR